MVSVMSVTSIPTLSIDEMRQILIHLPEPTRIELNLIHFDYSATKKQADSYAKQLSVDLNDEIHARTSVYVKDPTKDKLLNIYSDSVKQNRNDGVEEWIDKVFLDFKEANWRLELDERKRAGLEIKLNPEGLNISTHLTNLPTYITDTIAIIAGTNIKYDMHMFQKPYQP